ncbi:hypothetical protein F4810DRAFT_720185 [Camillea tinctor]|nr:hypothetical protein F4810DRAFT_720185 [Camillea tinctor]
MAPPSRFSRDPAQAADIDQTGVPAHPLAYGQMLTNGLFQCLERRQDNSVCYSQMKNTKKCIGSHRCKHHSGPGSAYQRGQAPVVGPAGTEPIYCPILFCGSSVLNVHSLVQHLRSIHEWTGDSVQITDQARALAQTNAWANPAPSAQPAAVAAAAAPAGGAAAAAAAAPAVAPATTTKRDEEDEEDDDDDTLFVKQDRHDDEDSGAGGAPGPGQGPPGVGGAQAVVV